MNKEILISSKSEILINILNGRATAILRKNIPKGYTGWINIYCNKEGYVLIDQEIKDGDYHIIGDARFLIGTEKDPNPTSFPRSVNGKVVARFWFDEYEKYENTDLYSYTYRHRIDKLFNQACITGDELYKYIKKVKSEEETTYRKYYPFYAWHIKQLEIFDKPKELNEFYKTNLPYVGAEEIEYALEINNVDALKHYSLSKAPLNYQLVYVKE